MIMNTQLLLSAALGVLPIFSACKPRPKADTTGDALAGAFGDVHASPAPGAAPPPVAVPVDVPALQSQVVALRQEIQLGELLNAGLRVRQLQTATNLNSQQLRALHETAAQIQMRLIERANAGDASARRQWEEYQKALTR